MSRFAIPDSVKREAKLGLDLRHAGYQGGTPTGWGRARQLIVQPSLDIQTLRTMRAWFARHGPGAANGGTSYRGYQRWINDGRPMSGQGSNKYRGAVAWLIWGGTSAYNWIRSAPIQSALNQYFPVKSQRRSSIKQAPRSRRRTGRRSGRSRR